MCTIKIIMTLVNTMKTNFPNSFCIFKKSKLILVSNQHLTSSLTSGVVGKHSAMSVRLKLILTCLKIHKTDIQSVYDTRYCCMDHVTNILILY